MFAFVAVIVAMFARFVIEFCAVAFNVPLNVPPLIMPLTLISVKLPVVELKVFAAMVPLAVRFVNPLIVVRFAVVALNVLAATVPLTVRLFKPVRFVMFAFVAVIVAMFARFVIEF